jgi:hypothetical protein
MVRIVCTVQQRQRTKIAERSYGLLHGFFFVTVRRTVSNFNHTELIDGSKK